MSNIDQKLSLANLLGMIIEKFNRSISNNDNELICNYGYHIRISTNPYNGDPLEKLYTYFSYEDSYNLTNRIKNLSSWLPTYTSTDKKINITKAINMLDDNIIYSDSNRCKFNAAIMLIKQLLVEILKINPNSRVLTCLDEIANEYIESLEGKMSKLNLKTELSDYQLQKNKLIDVDVYFNNLYVMKLNRLLNSIEIEWKDYDYKEINKIIKRNIMEASLIKDNGKEIIKW